MLTPKPKGMNKLEEIQKLKSLLDQGAITDEEFQSLKRKVLDSTFQQESSTDSVNSSTGNQGNFSSGENQGNIARPTVSNWQPPKKTNINYAAIVLAAIAAISVFLPWAEATSSVTGFGNSSHYSSGGISGISIPAIGTVGLLMALIGGGLAIAGTKWASIFGIINVIDGIGYAFGWFDTKGKVNVNGAFGDSNYHAEVEVNPQYGLYLFIFASFLFVIFSLTHKMGDIKKIGVTNLKPPKKTKLNYYARIFASIAAISFLLPWKSFDYSHYAQGGGAFSVLVCLIIAIAGIVLAFKGTKWVAVIGIINLVIGIGYAYDLLRNLYKISIVSSYGLFLFLISSILLIYFSLTPKFYHEHTSSPNPV
jgi:hypothetical protein